MKKEYIYAGISIFFWSTTATVTKLLLGGLNSMQVVLISSLFSCAFLFLLCLFKGDLKDAKNYKFTDYIHMFGLGVLGIFIYHLFLYAGIDKMLASQAFIINYLWPIATVIFACIILKEKMTFRKSIAIAMSFLGVIIVTSNGNLLSIDKDTLIGAALCIIAALSYGFFSVLNKKKPYNKYFSMMFYYFASFVASLVYLLLIDNIPTPTSGEWIGLTFNGIFTTAIPYLTWALALSHGDTARISNLAYITPFLSLVWTALVLKEPIGVYSVLGLVVIVLGIFVQLTDGSKKHVKK